MKKPKEKIKIEETKKLDFDRFEGSFESIKASIDGLIEDGWVGISVEYDYDNPWDNHLSPYYVAYRHREETAKEYEKRVEEYDKYLANLKKEKIKQEQRERKLLEQLQEKYK
jgi:phenylpropionate dioxygenase-like ring-hydroxylating dioxygenase large terminal subunit